jgi:acyl-CoA oxidase
MVMDAAAATLCTIQYNLSAGTLIRYATRRTDFDQIIEKILRFEVMWAWASSLQYTSAYSVFSGQYCMTELDHGLDIINMETTATMMSNGEWDLHTPHDRAAKYI